MRKGLFWNALGQVAGVGWSEKENEMQGTGQTRDESHHGHKSCGNLRFDLSH
jgi:hypothetical protein